MPRRPVRAAPPFAPRALSLALLLAALSAPLPAGAETRVYATGGIHSPVGGDEREVFGLAPQFGLGIQTGINETGSMIGFEVGYVRSGGHPSDLPTFESPESHYTLVPITMTLSTVTGRNPDAWPRMNVGLFATVMPTTYTDRNGEDHATPTVGAGLELRPEFRLSGGWRAIGRTRLLIVDGVDYRNAIADINYSALSFELGLSAGLR
jgi:hypothetical protein